MSCLINPYKGERFTVCADLDATIYNQHWSIRIQPGSTCKVRVSEATRAIAYLSRKVMPTPDKFQHCLKNDKNNEVELNDEGLWYILAVKDSEEASTRVSIDFLVKDKVEKPTEGEQTEGEQTGVEQTEVEQTAGEELTGLEGLLKDKWSRDSLVSTNNSETQFIYGSNAIRKVRERYTYYYHVSEILPLINHLVNKASKELEVTVKSYLIEDADLFKLLDQSTVEKINQVYLLTVKRREVTPQYRALFLTGTHAREAAGPTTLLSFADQLVENDSETRSLLDEWSISFVFSINPLGYYIDNSKTVKRSSGQIDNIPGRYHRKNDSGITSLPSGNYPKRVKVNYQSGDRSCGASIPSLVSGARVDVGVDINRNCGENFQFDGKTTNYWSRIGSGQTYSGLKANSEKETIIFQQIFDQVNPNLFISVHSYGNIVVTSDVFDDSSNFTAEQKLKASRYRLAMKSYYSVPSVYRFSHIVDDYDFYSAITKGVTFRQEGLHRGTGEYVKFPTQVCPLGTARGEMTHWAYVHQKNKGFNQPFNSFTLELGTSGGDGFYPNKYQMIDIIYNGWSILTKSLIHFKQHIKYNS